MKKLLIGSVLSVLVVSACASNQSSGGHGTHGIGGFFQGVAHLVLSPIQIASGLLEGVASLPYYASTGLHAINDGMVKAQASITLDDTYESAYGKRIDEVNDDGDTNEKFRRMKHATEYFQKILKQYGVVDYQHYILTSIDTANGQGATLFAVVYRPADKITVIDKYDHKTVRQFTASDRLFYEPFLTDINGVTLDVIVDWAGVATDSYREQKQQAVLLTLSANAVVAAKRRDDYWENEQRWINGQFMPIIEAQNAKVDRSMRI